jgi:hypothetical protein
MGFIYNALNFLNEENKRFSNCFFLPLFNFLFIFSFFIIIYFFDMSTQEGGGGFELVTSVSLGVVPTD